MSPVGGNQNNGPSAVVSKGSQSPHRTQPPPPPPAQHNQPAAPHTHLHHQPHLNSRSNHHQNVPQHHQQQLTVNHGHGHPAGAPGQGQGNQMQGHLGSGLHLGIGGGAQANHINHGQNSLAGHNIGHLIGAQIAGIGGGIGAGVGAGLGGGIGAGVGGGLGGGIGGGIEAGLGSGMGGGHGDLLSGLNVGIGGGGQLNVAQNTGLGGGLGENIGPLNAILGGLTGFGNSNSGLNGGLDLGTQGQGPSHGHSHNPLGAHPGNGNGLIGQAGNNHANSELIYQLLAGHSLNAMLEGQNTGAFASLISSQNSAGKPSDILLQSLLGGNSINSIPNFSSLNSLLPGLRGSKSTDLGQVSSFLNGHATSLSPSFGVTQQPVVIKSNGGQLNIGLKKDPSTGKQNIVIQTAAAVMANEMMEAEPGEAP